MLGNCINRKISLKLSFFVNMSFVGHMRNINHRTCTLQYPKSSLESALSEMKILVRNFILILKIL